MVVNCQYSRWSKLKTGVPQGLILGPLFFVVYINELPDDLATNAKLSADDASLFFSVAINNDFLIISQWTYQWKIIFNPDFSKQAQ